MLHWAYFKWRSSRPEFNGLFPRPETQFWAMAYHKWSEDYGFISFWLLRVERIVSKPHWVASTTDSKLVSHHNFVMFTLSCVPRLLTMTQFKWALNTLTQKTVHVRRQAAYTVRNVQTKPALFRANTPSKEILPMVVPANLLFIFIFIVTLILDTMQSFKHHLQKWQLDTWHCVSF